ncbi:MAG: tRNA pseudouridine(38-40) synthase TruA [Planctomycetes bacterium]|nr:tRNA pseudouridine(38-40) synthase TruA [Planctomycetota bacterium]
MDSREEPATATKESRAEPLRRKIKLVIAYDGTDYHGWQIQPGFRTVQGMLCEAAAAVLHGPTHVQGAGRTDAGVHAQGQVGLIETAQPIPTEYFHLALNDHLPQDIVVLSAREVGPDFDVMADVTRKVYRYTIYTGRLRPVRQIRFCWHFPGALSVEAMQAAARHLVGTHDFRSFAAAVEEGQATVRTLFRCEVTQGGAGECDRIAIDMEGSGFLHHMARLIAGTLIDIGRGHWPPEHMADILAARHRAAAGHLAPAGGLSLEWIKFRRDDPACGLARDRS